jgi:hypothetical protein
MKPHECNIVFRHVDYLGTILLLMSARLKTLESVVELIWHTTCPNTNTPFHTFVCRAHGCSACDICTYTYFVNGIEELHNLQQLKGAFLTIQTSNFRTRDGINFNTMMQRETIHNNLKIKLLGSMQYLIGADKHQTWGANDENHFHDS